MGLYRVAVGRRREERVVALALLGGEHGHGKLLFCGLLSWRRFSPTLDIRSVPLYLKKKGVLYVFHT